MRRAECRRTSDESAAVRHSHGGFTIVEAMVALVVLSVGMIGVAALHGQSLSAGRSALYRSVAVMLAADLADRIRANRTGAAAYAGAPAAGGCGPDGGSRCSPEAMAAHDLHLWDRQVRDTLPNGQWEVSYDGAANPRVYTIDVLWDDVGAAANPVSHRLVLQLPVY